MLRGAYGEDDFEVIISMLEKLYEMSRWMLCDYTTVKSHQLAISGHRQ